MDLNLYFAGNKIKLKVSFYWFPPRMKHVLFLLLSKSLMNHLQVIIQNTHTLSLWVMHACMCVCVCMHVCVCVCMHVCVCVHACMHACVCVFMFGFLHDWLSGNTITQWNSLIQFKSINQKQISQLTQNILIT